MLLGATPMARLGTGLTGKVSGQFAVVSSPLPCVMTCAHRPWFGGLWPDFICTCRSRCRWRLSLGQPLSCSRGGLWPCVCILDSVGDAHASQAGLCPRARAWADCCWHAGGFVPGMSWCIDDAGLLAAAMIDAPPCSGCLEAGLRRTAIVIATGRHCTVRCRCERLNSLRG